MKYKRFGSRMVLRIDRGEEVLTQLHRAAEQEGIRLAAVSGLGAVGDFTVGVFHTAEKQYHAHRFQGDFEIVSLVGTITTKDGKVYEASMDVHPGHPKAMFTWEEMAQRFRMQTTGVLSPEQCEEAIRAIMGLESCKDVASLSHLLHR